MQQTRNMSDEHAPTGPSRRAFLTGSCAALVGLVGTALLADNATAAPGITRAANGKVAVKVAKIPALSKVGGMVNLGTVKGVPVAVVRTGPTTYSALNLRCTHMGVTVEPVGAGFVCPAHGSQFSDTGAVQRGPASRPLATVHANGNLMVG